MKITQTAFYLLGASVHSSRSEIRELADEASFIKDESECRNAARNLLQPNKRIEQETAWLPGVPPQSASQLVENALNGRFSRRYKGQEGELTIPPLASCNLLTAAIPNILSLSAGLTDLSQLDGVFRAAADIYDSLDGEAELDAINDARSVAGFSPITDNVLLSECIENQRKELRSAVYQILCNVDDENIETRWFSDTIDDVTEKGNKPNLTLLDDLISEYELKKKDFHAQKEEEISIRLDALRKNLEDKEPKELKAFSRPDLEEIRQLVDIWSQSLYPVLISYKSRGLAYRSADDIVAQVRAICVFAVQECEEYEVFEVLGESLAFAVNAVPKFSDLVKSDLEYLHGGFRDNSRLSKIKVIFEKYENVPTSKLKIISTFRELQELIKIEIQTSNIGEKVGDWICFLLCRYGSELANKYGDFTNAVKVFDFAKSLPLTSDAVELLNCNIKRAKRNKLYLVKRIEEEKEKKRLHEISVVKVKAANRVKSIVAAFLCLCVIIVASALLFYVRSPEYEWSFISNLTLHRQAHYLNYTPTSPNKKKITVLIAQQIRNINSPAERLSTIESIPLSELDEEALFTVFSTSPTLESLKLFESMCPSASAYHKKQIEKQKKELAESAWNAIALPYSKKEVEIYLEKYGEIVSKTEIQRRVCDYLLKELDKKRISDFLDFFDENTSILELRNCIKEIEKTEWLSKVDSFDSIQKLDEYNQTITSEEVKRLISERREQLEMEQWSLAKKSFKTKNDVCDYIDAITNKHVLEEAEKLITQFEKAEWLERAQTLTTEHELLAYKNSLKSEEVKAMVDDYLKKQYSNFHFAQSINTKAAYERFILYSNNPQEREKARQKIIDIEVAEIEKGNYSPLPQQNYRAQKVTKSGITEIEISNQTKYSLTVMYSGVQSKKIVIPSYETRRVRIKSGYYAIAVTTEQSNVVPFYGRRRLDSGKYKSTFYIEEKTTESYPYIPSSSSSYSVPWYNHSPARY